MRIVDYLSNQGLALKQEGTNYGIDPCPFCGHRGCFKVNAVEDYFNCFSCGVAGNAIKYEELVSGITHREAIKTVNGEASPFYYPSKDLAEHHYLLQNPEPLLWLTEGRKFNLATLKRFKIGYFKTRDDKTIYTFPYYRNGLLINTKYRTADKTLMYFKKGCETILYNIDAAKDKDTVLIVEGEPDCLASYTYDLNIPTIAVGTGAKSFKEAWLKDLEHAKTVYACLDMDEVGRAGTMKLAQKLGKHRTLIVELPKKDLNDCLMADIPKDDILACIQKAKSPYQLEIMEAIMSIPKDEPLVGSKINDVVLPLIAKRPKAEIEDYIRLMRERWLEVGFKQSRDWRNVIDSIRYEAYETETNDDSKEAPLPIVDEALNNEAMEFLKNPDLLKILETHLTTLGIIGEEENKVALWLFMLTRKLEKQIHAVVFGQSASGKSELVKKVLSTVPEEEVLEYSSLSSRALDYRPENDLVGKVISIAEYEGAADIEYTIRTAQSEGKITRGYTIRDEETGELKNAVSTVECKSVFIITTTKSSIHNENSTRVFSLYVNESVSQTQKVCDFIRHTQSREWKFAEKDRRRLMDVIKTAQRLLNPIEIIIPYAGLLEFPENTTRNRRDLSRFLSFIQVIAFLRQNQKEAKTDELGTYLEADIKDYELAYNYLLPILRNTLDEISPRAFKALEICCFIQDDIKAENFDLDQIGFTIKDIQQKAIVLGVDLKNSTNLRNELYELCENEYLELVSGKWGLRGSRQVFKVICNYDINHSEQTVVNIRNKNIGILTPEELKNNFLL